MRKEYPVEVLCRVLEVSQSSYYDWRNGKTYQVNYQKQIMEHRVIAIFWENKRRYGARRVAAALQQQNIPMSLYMVRKILKENGLKAIQPRSFIPKTTNSKHSKSMSPNLLKERRFPSSINEVWVGDITYIPMANGTFSYLSVWMDLYSRRILGWSLKMHMQESLVIESFVKSLETRPISPGLMVHSDRGGQYAGNAFRRHLLQVNAIQSMSDADNPYDNAYMESCFSRFKAELIQDGTFRNVEDATTEIADYLAYYNTTRLHSSLEYMSPVNFELQLQKQKK